MPFKYTTCGATLWRLRSELAGIGLDPQMTRFFKQEAEVQAAHSLAEGVTMVTSGGALQVESS